MQKKTRLILERIICCQLFTGNTEILLSQTGEGRLSAALLDGLVQAKALAFSKPVSEGDLM